ncbi:protein of unknown function [Taphrina deformans PYCC 5710]|uniref:Mitochondrial distribution and morphology protein 12 n=1 Tax=Taphrina deformans (strain PYCC 5710 / ATCC 11124 / CBS 356.35 / IMI 108563 / JCM 9778 / NBRC 8474) TaxID=1097556 RepID=R4XEJ7_TAPDE|nr:protein of unknown function [Taphrina deformans PYCC 5710]|eukprot:CCG84191.1 protein of unknown function [Taphrina deformans PYCC 5710]
MSLEVNWKALDPALGSSLRTLLNARLTNAHLPGFLRNVDILSFNLGSVPPEIVIKDITDPFPEFYEDDSEAEMQDTSGVEEERGSAERDAGRQPSETGLGISPAQRRRSSGHEPTLSSSNIHNDEDDHETASVLSGPPPYAEHLSHRPMNSMSGWEGMNVPYFQSAFATPNQGIVSASGLSTPRPRFLGWANAFQPADTTSISSSNDHGCDRRMPSQTDRRTSMAGTRASINTPGDPSDVQLEVQLRYTGDIVVKLKVDLALNYPSPFFVTLPVEMTISDLLVDTTAVAAYIDDKVHVSLLEGIQNPIQDFKIKSKIGEQDKVSLTDLEKVEKFMLKEIQSVVEKELVFPSYYTFLL